MSDRPGSGADALWAAGSPGLGAPEGTEWETVIGLEVHAELLTRTKLFSSSPNAFGGEPNTHIDPVCLGLPGTLPVLNRHAVELAVRVGLALGAEVRPSIFARKNYFYPDMPKDYQISQYDRPINVGGRLELPSGKVVRIERAHLEEDTGKTTHMGGAGRIDGAAYSLVDYNRAGVPLLEIVSRPDMRSAAEAREFVAELRATLVAVGASDGKMEEGSLRVDANVSVRPAGVSRLGTRCEIKNVNSLRSLGRALEHEARRQIELLTSGEAVAQQTRHWDEDEGRTTALRSKEEATDYRYFPEPDLVPLAPEGAWVEQIRAELPLLPRQRRRRLADATDEAPARVSLIVERGQDDLALEAVEAGAPAAAVLKHLEQNLAGGTGALTAAGLAELLAMEESAELTSNQVKDVLADMARTGQAPAAVARRLGFEAVGAGELAVLVDRMIAEHPEEWRRLCSGEGRERKKMQGFFTGQVMRATKGQADGRRVAALLAERAGS
ncbi:MAG: Asp-tRNA(Asn)/Glu-tRNA(Gln) amidotransferase subunit GatB [bacterium]|nr:Asp-tRNA(Asn)/Glu-tRNA(Gln) amidotransferase subunit GatB [bacterium]